MAKKKKPKQAKAIKPAAAEATFPPEERRAEVATVAWMLTALITSVAVTASLCVRLYFALVPEPPKSLAPLALVPGMVLIIGLITGSLCLILTIIIYQLRRTPPPIMITIFAVLVSLIPYATLTLNWLRR